MELELQPIPNVIGYAASKCGQIISYHRLAPFSLKASRHSSGYAQVNLKVDGGYRTFLVHRLVMAAWIGPCPDGAVTNHINGIKTDNRLENLEYCSQSENMAHSFRTGLSPKPPTRRGENAPKAKLTPEQVVELRKEAEQGCQLKHLAAKYGITTPTASKVVLRQTWRHVR